MYVSLCHTSASEGARKHSLQDRQRLVLPIAVRTYDTTTLVTQVFRESGQDVRPLPTAGVATLGKKVSPKWSGFCQSLLKQGALDTTAVGWETGLSITKDPLANEAVDSGILRLLSMLQTEWIQCGF